MCCGHVSGHVISLRISISFCWHYYMQKLRNGHQINVQYNWYRDVVAFCLRWKETFHLSSSIHSKRLQLLVDKAKKIRIWFVISCDINQKPTNVPMTCAKQPFNLFKVLVDLLVRLPLTGARIDYYYYSTNNGEIITLTMDNCYFPSRLNRNSSSAKEEKKKIPFQCSWHALITL